MIAPPCLVWLSDALTDRRIVKENHASETEILSHAMCRIGLPIRGCGILGHHFVEAKATAHSQARYSRAWLFEITVPNSHFQQDGSVIIPDVDRVDGVDTTDIGSPMPSVIEIACMIDEP